MNPVNIPRFKGYYPITYLPITMVEPKFIEQYRPFQRDFGSHQLYLLVTGKDKTRHKDLVTHPDGQLRIVIGADGNSLGYSSPWDADLKPVTTLEESGKITRLLEDAKAFIHQPMMTGVKPFFDSFLDKSRNAIHRFVAQLSGLGNL